MMRCLRFAVPAVLVLASPVWAQGNGGDCRVDGDLPGQIKRCSEIISDSTVLRPARGVAYLYRCQARDMQGDFSAALGDCLTSVDLNPDDASTYNSLNIVYRNLGRYRDSVAAATKAMELNPDEGSHYAGRAASYCKLGDYTASLKDRLKAIELGYLNVERVQEFLKSKGFYTKNVDGKMGDGTLKALRDWTDGGC